MWLTVFNKIINKIGWQKFLVFLLLVLVGISLRLYFMLQMSFTNDEGAYLYDAKTLLAGNLSGGDVVTKSPVAIFVFTFFVWLTQGSLYAVRIASLLFGLATLLPLFVLGWAWCRKNVVLVVVVWLVFSAPIVLFVLGHTEACAVFFSSVALALLAMAFCKEKSGWLFVASGIAFILALGSRKINLALVFPILVLFFQGRNQKITSKRKLTLFFAGAIAMGTILLAVVFRLYGWAGVREFVGLGYAQIVGSRVLGDAKVDIWGINFVDAVRIIARVATAHIVLGITGILAVMGVFFKQGRTIIKNPIFVPLSWLIGLVVLYSVWPTFLPDYTADFLVPITLLGVFAIGGIWVRSSKLIKVIFVVSFIVLNTISYISVIKSPWTGMFNSASARMMALKIQQLIPTSEPILTAGTIVPYLSGHRTYGDISHPLWYRYNFISAQEKNIFLPDWEKVASEIKTGKTKWVLLEHLTDYAYFRNDDQLINQLVQNWELVSTVPNNTGFRSNTLKLYRRKE